MANDFLEAHPDASPRQRTLIVAIASIFGIVVAASIALWAHYGTAVFFNAITTGLAACF